MECSLEVNGHDGLVLSVLNTTEGCVQMANLVTCVLCSLPQNKNGEW